MQKDKSFAEYLLLPVHRPLLGLPPETAHAVAKKFMMAGQKIWFRTLKRKLPKAPAIHVSSVPNIKFRSRVGIAAGLDKDAEFFAALGLLGAGFVEVGTITPQGQEGNPKPRLWRPAPGTLINHMGFNSSGLTAAKRNILAYRESTKGLPLFANIGKNRHTPLEGALEDYRRGFNQLTGFVDGFVVNLSSPNTPGLTDLQNENFLQELVRFTPANTPVWVKLSPDLPNPVLESLAGFVEREKAITGIVVTNTSREMAEEVFGWDKGGLSGRPLFSRALECVSITRQAAPSKTIVGVGGVWNRDTAVQMLRAGADLIEVYTGFVYQGPALLRALSDLD